MVMDEETYDFKMGWSSLVRILASDQVAFFLTEMSLDGIYSPDLRHLAREFVITAENGIWPDDLVNAVPDVFLSHVASDIGEDVANALDKWGRKACPTYEIGSLIGRWQLLLDKLVISWDKGNTYSGLSLDLPEETGLRLMVRRYLACVNDVSIETDRVWNVSNSEWEQNRKGIGITSASIWARVLNIASTDLWKDFIKRLSSDQSSKLLSWATEITKGNEYTCRILTSSLGGVFRSTS